MVKFVKRQISEYGTLLKSVPALITMFFCISVVAMNLMANKIIINTPIVAADGGLLLSWIPFLCMDLVVKRFGPKAATKLNVVALVTNLIFVGLFAAVSALHVGIGNISSIDPTYSSWSEYWGTFSAFESTFSCTWFVLLGSSIAFLVSGVVNNYVNVAVGHLFRNTKKKRTEFIVRSYVSTFCGQFFDNLLFAVIVFMIFAPIYWGYSLTFVQCMGSAVLGSTLELIMESIFSPFGYKISKKWEKNNVGVEYIEAYGTK